MELYDIMGLVALWAEKVVIIATLLEKVVKYRKSWVFLDNLAVLSINWQFYW